MSYKPYKVNRGEYYPKGKESKYEIKRMKFFGFRSGIAWKMIPALFYYLLVITLLCCSIYGEVKEFTFVPMDVVLTVLKYISFFVMALSPAIFLSDYDYVKQIPLFNSPSTGKKAIGMILVVVFSWLMIWTYQYRMSDTYKDSAKRYYERIEAEQEKAIQEYESQSLHETETESATSE